MRLLTVKLERRPLSALPKSAIDGSLSAYPEQLLAFSSPCYTQNTSLHISIAIRRAAKGAQDSTKTQIHNTALT